MESVGEFYNNNKILCISTLGLAVVGFLIYREVRHLLEKFGVVEKVDHVARSTIEQTTPLNPTPLNRPISLPRTTSSNSTRTPNVLNTNRLIPQIGPVVQNHDQFNPRQQLLDIGMAEQDVPFVPRVGSFLFAYHQDEPHAPILLQRELTINVSPETINRIVGNAGNAYQRYLQTHDVGNAPMPPRLPNNWEVSASVSVYGPLTYQDYGAFFQGWLFDNNVANPSNYVGLTYFRPNNGIVPQNNEEFLQENEVRFFDQHAHRDDNDTQYTYGTGQSKIRFRPNTPAELIVVCLDPIRERIHFSFIYANQTGNPERFIDQVRNQLPL